MINSDKKINKIQDNVASIVCRCITLSDKARALIREKISVEDFIKLLLDNALESDAIQFLAYALPKREAVWWACLGVRDGYKEEIKQAVNDCLIATEEWVYQQSDSLRRSLFSFAENLGFDTPASYAAMAGYWSGGSIAPPDLLPIEPNQNLTPTAVAAAITLSAALQAAGSIVNHQRHSIQRALNIAQGGNGQIN